MKKFLVAGLAAVLFTCLAGPEARAQYWPSSIEQERGRLVSDTDEVLPDYMVQRLVGDEIYNETYLGARKQYKTGKRLIIGGLAAGSAGLVVSGVSLGVFMADYIRMWGTTDNVWDNFSGAKDSVSWFYRGFTVAGAGAALFSAGLIFKTIGWKRLEWVADSYNQSQHPVTVAFGPGHYGTGLTVTF